MFRSKAASPKIILAIILIIISLLSVTVLSSVFSSPKAYSKTISTLDDQKQVATTMSLAVTAASTALSALHDDTATPIANKLADLSLPLFIIVCILYTEKFLLTSFGWFSFTFLFPAALMLSAISVFVKKDILLPIIKKLFILAIALILIIPVSAKITVQVQETFSETVSQAFDAAQFVAGETNASESEDANAFAAFFANLKDNVSALINRTTNMLSVFTDAIAVLLITSCIIPILTMLMFIWIVKIVFGISVPIEKLKKALSNKNAETNNKDC